MSAQTKILVQYQPSDTKVYLLSKNSKKKLMNKSNTEDTTIDQTKKNLYKITKEIRKIHSSTPIEIDLKNTPKDMSSEKWKSFINEFFATTGASIGVKK